MRIKKESRMSWQEAPDIISPEDLSNITGIGIQSCRKLFDSPDFPSINKSIITLNISSIIFDKFRLIYLLSIYFIV